MLMIVLETIFSLILKHDRVVALQAKKFVDQKITIKINSYIPYFRHLRGIQSKRHLI